jgi:hypothetical protein
MAKLIYIHLLWMGGDLNCPLLSSHHAALGLSKSSFFASFKKQQRIGQGILQSIAVAAGSWRSDLWSKIKLAADHLAKHGPATE